MAPKAHLTPDRANLNTPSLQDGALSKVPFVDTLVKPCP